MGVEEEVVVKGGGGEGGGGSGKMVKKTPQALPQLIFTYPL